jgi:hypothetical protein
VLRSRVLSPELFTWFYSKHRSAAQWETLLRSQPLRTEDVPTVLAALPNDRLVTLMARNCDAVGATDRASIEEILTEVDSLSRALRLVADGPGTWNDVALEWAQGLSHVDAHAGEVIARALVSFRGDLVNDLALLVENTVLRDPIMLSRNFDDPACQRLAIGLPLAPTSSADVRLSWFSENSQKVCMLLLNPALHESVLDEIGQLASMKDSSYSAQRVATAYAKRVQRWGRWCYTGDYQRESDPHTLDLLVESCRGNVGAIGAEKPYSFRVEEATLLLQNPNLSDKQRKIVQGFWTLDPDRDAKYFSDYAGDDGWLHIAPSPLRQAPAERSTKSLNATLRKCSVDGFIDLSEGMHQSDFTAWIAKTIESRPDRLSTLLALSEDWHSSMGSLVDTVKILTP